MNPTYLAPLLSGFLLISVATVANTQSSSANPSPSVASPGCFKSTGGQNAAKELAQRIAQLEVERVLLGVRFSQTHPDLVLLNRKKSSLETCLTQVQPNDKQNLVVTAIVSATEAKIAELETQYTDNQIRFTDDHPTQQYLRKAIAALRQHLTTLQ